MRPYCLTVRRQSTVYTTPAPKGTKGPRRVSEGPPPSSQNSDGVQQRHSSASIVTSRPANPTALSSSASASTSMGTFRTSAPSPATPRSAALSMESPVMSETLSVIDEHMNHMSSMGKTRAPYANGGKRSSGNTWSAHSLHRASYIAGHETDEEDEHAHTEQEVMVWSADRVAEYLQDHGVEQAHCDVFRDQEITGEVALAMDQSSVFIKEFELGSVGRRLKTWHKIKALQDEVRHNAINGIDKMATSEYSETGNSVAEDSNRRRSSTLPHALESSRPLSATGKSVTSQAMAGAGALQVPPSPTPTPVSRVEQSSPRPSAQSIRQMQGSRRHSSIESVSNPNDGGFRHRKQSSFDAKWQSPPTSSRSRHTHTMSAESNSRMAKRSSAAPASTTSPDIDRGYFSSTEADGRSSRASRNVLLKTSGTGTTSLTHSRNPSQQQQFDNRVSMGASMEDLSASARTSRRKATGLRSLTSPTAPSRVTSSAQSEHPIVTKLDGPAKANAQSSSGNSEVGSFFRTQRLKLTGLRVVSDAITKTEKSTSSPPLLKDDHVPSPASFGSSMGSSESKGVTGDKSEEQSRTSQGSMANLQTPATRPTRPRARTRTKKATSAYTRGLERKTPAESLANCDYSGWMKKKSGSLMTTWKPRLFVLRGRRLSYYYSEDDCEEKGLIDISFHRVLPAQSEMLTGLHAHVTGAASQQTSPKESNTPTAAEQDLKEHRPGPCDGEGIFIFKLVPPKTGLAKGVSFTRPTVHYFAVNSRMEGRLWMAALMKATIDRDDDGVVTTTYNQKTISLTKARARHERPPALREDSVEAVADGASADSVKSGVASRSPGEAADNAATAGAESTTASGRGAEDSSIAPSGHTDTSASASVPPTEDLDAAETATVASSAHQ